MASCLNVDFIPVLLKKQAFVTPAVYESFSVLISRANDWLEANPSYDVLTCESIETYMEPCQRAFNSDNAGFVEHNHISQLCYLTFLRIWVVPRKEGSGPTIIGYMNVVPKCVENSKYPQFESIQQTIGDANATLKENPIPGKIFKVETITVTFRKLPEAIDADVTLLMKYRPNIFTHLQAIRIFYTQGTPQNEQIGVMDFVPMQIGEQMILNKPAPSYEPLSELMKKVFGWIGSSSNSVKNIQSLWSKFAKQVTAIDTDCSAFHDEMYGNFYHVRFIRVGFVMGGSTKNASSTYRTFSPVQLGKHGAASYGQFEGLAQTMSRVQAWLEVTGAKITGMETVLTDVTAVNALSGSDDFANSERTIDIKQAKGRHWYTWYLRFYFEGPYQEPSPEQLPPVPQMNFSSPSQTCNIL